MKSLVVYYSRTGTTKKAANEIANLLKADIDEIIDKKKRDGIFGYLSAGRDALNNKLTNIERPKIDSTKYDLVVIGTPIWAGKITPAIRAYVKDKNFNKIAFFVTAGSGDGKEAFAELEKLTKKPVAALELSTKEVSNNKHKERILNFCKKLKG